MTDIDVYRRERARNSTGRSAKPSGATSGSACKPSSPPCWRSTRRPPSTTSRFACNDGDESSENDEDVHRRHVETVEQLIGRLEERRRLLIPEPQPE